MKLAVLAAAGLAARLAAAAPLGAGALDGGGEVQIQGDVTYDPATGVVLVENGAVIQRGGVVLHARSATYDPATGEVRASGNVLLTDALRAISADGVRFVFGGPFEADEVVAFQKGVPADLRRASSLEEARRVGWSRLAFSGSLMRGDERGRFTLEHARLTLCDCGEGCAPSWELTSRHADVIPGVRATLSWPVLRVTPRFLFIDHPVPVLVLPWLYVPLGERQTGLLLPEIDTTPATGWAIFQPVFITLGRSADATVTPGYAWGPGSVSEGKPKVRGPGARLELRWAPAERAEGQVLLSWVDDRADEPGGESGNRFAAVGRHVQRLSDSTAVQASLRLYGDPVWSRDLSAEVLAREIPYARSEALVSNRHPDLVLEAQTAYLEPLRPNGYLKRPDGTYEPKGDFGTFGSGYDVASPWLAASATLAPIGLGPLRVSGRAGVARFAPVASAWDSGTCWNQPSGSGCTDPLRRAATDRADARVEVAAPIVLGEVASLTPYATGAAVGYAFEADHGPTASAWGVGGVALGTEVSRRFGELRHAIAPRFEWRAGTANAGQGIGWYAYDAWDRTGAGFLTAAPPGVWQQLRGTVETRLSRAGADLLRLEVGQDYDLHLDRFGETFGRADFGWRRVGASLSVRGFAFQARPVPAPPPSALVIRDPFLDHFTELGASASVSDERGDLVRAGFYSVAAGGPATVVAGIDPLFDLRPSATDPSATASLGAKGVWSGATVSYDVLLYGRDQYATTCGSSTPRHVSAGEPIQHVVTAQWDSPCHCFRILAIGRVNDCGQPSGHVVIDLSQLGGARAGR